MHSLTAHFKPQSAQGRVREFAEAADDAVEEGAGAAVQWEASWFVDVADVVDDEGAGEAAFELGSVVHVVHVHAGMGLLIGTGADVADCVELKGYPAHTGV